MTIPDSTYIQKPGKVQAIAIMTLINGILNIIAGISLTVTVVFGTVGFGLLCFPVTILPSVLGIFEVMGGAKLLANPPRKFNVQTIAIMEIVAILFAGVPSMVIGILNLVFYNEPEVKAYIDGLPG